MVLKAPLKSLGIRLGFNVFAHRERFTPQMRAPSGCGGCFRAARSIAAARIKQFISGGAERKRAGGRQKAYQWREGWRNGAWRNGNGVMALAAIISENG